MRVLFITTQFPYPLDNGGKIGAINGLDLLRNDEVTLLSFCEQPDLIQDGVDFLSKRFPKLRIVNPIIHDIHIQKKGYYQFIFRKVSIFSCKVLG